MIEYKYKKMSFETEREALAAWLHDVDRQYYGISKYRDGKLNWSSQPKITNMETGIKDVAKGKMKGGNARFEAWGRVETIEGINILIV